MLQTTPQIEDNVLEATKKMLETELLPTIQNETASRMDDLESVLVTQNIEKDEEILVNYGLPMADAPLWYKHLWVHHCRVNEGWSDERILKWCYHKYEMHGKTVQLPI